MMHLLNGIARAKPRRRRLSSPLWQSPCQALPIHPKEAVQPLQANKQIASALTENCDNKVGKQHKAERKKNQKK
jgi:hypothetical protein